MSKEIKNREDDWNNNSREAGMNRILIMVSKISLDDIEALVKQGESINLEFKTSTSKLYNVFETLCAFLNGNGGTILIGVKNNGDIVGQDVTDSTRLEIANLVSKIEPPTTLEINYVLIEKNKYIIKIDAISNRTSVPYVFDGKPYWRVESSTKLMPQQRYQQLLLEKTQKRHSWELAKAEHFTIDDLDKTEIISAIDDAIGRGRMEAGLATQDPKEALMRLKLIVSGNVTNAAVVLFCGDPMPYYPQCLLRLAKFKGADKSDLLDSKRIHANAFVLLREAEHFLMRHMSIRSEFVPGKMARKDIPDYPPRAIREAMINAVCHRDYTIQGGSISLFIYSDRLEITSHGTLPIGITIDDLKQTHESQPRNERITYALVKLGIIESVGTGTQEMIKECKLLGKPEPEYIERGNTFVVCFRAHSITDQPLNERQQKILVLLKEHGGLRSAEIKEKLGASITDRTLRRDLNYLREHKIVNLQGRGVSAMWFIDKDIN
ncbi:MAG: ATP-binding protein [Gammaproteobacteria bacterium]